MDEAITHSKNGIPIRLPEERWQHMGISKNRKIL